MKSALLATILLFLYVGCARKPSVDIQADLEQKFQQMMSGVTLIGHSASLKDESVAGEEREEKGKLGHYPTVILESQHMAIGRKTTKRKP